MTHAAVRYRPEVDGLRALAVLPVVLYHTGVPAFSGGYVGVDVFFVISGYLITSILLREYATGTYSLWRFYERRARRILPALLLVVLATVPVAWAWLPADALRDYSQSLLGVATFASNVHFWRESGYFTAANEFKPLIHTWSLAVEEQFYVLFPLLLWWLWRRRGSRVAWLGVAALAGLVAAEIMTQRAPSAAFFLLPARAWELLVGATLAAMAAPQEQGASAAPPRLLGEILAAAGMGLIVLAISRLDDKTPFPGVMATLPVIGTALVLQFGQGDTWVGWVLSRRPLVAIGLVSYSLYLWHQPLFAFARLQTLEEPPPAVMLALVTAAALLAVLSWRFVEQPFRNPRGVGRATLWRVAGLGSGVMLAAGLAGQIGAGRGLGRPPLPAALLESLKGGPTDPACRVNTGPRPIEAWACRFGGDSLALGWAVLGDSHAWALMPAFETVAREQGVRGVFAARSSCPPLLGVHRSRDPGCAQLITERFAQLRGERVPTVFLVARWAQYTDGDYRGRGMALLGDASGPQASRAASRTVLAAGLARTLDSLRAWGVRPIVVLQVPHQRYLPGRVYDRIGPAPGVRGEEVLRGLSVARSDHLRLQAASRTAIQREAERRGVTVLQMDDVFCSGDRCLLGSLVASFYKDHDHLSRAGALRVTARIRGALQDPPVPGDEPPAVP